MYGVTNYGDVMYLRSANMMHYSVYQAVRHDKHNSAVGYGGECHALATLVQLFEVLNLTIEIFFDLNCLDIADWFLANLTRFMTAFLTLMSYGQAFIFYFFSLLCLFFKFGRAALCSYSSSQRSEPGSLHSCAT